MVIRLGAQIRFIAMVVKCSSGALIVIVIEREGKWAGCERQRQRADRKNPLSFE